jgi:hypothetical protein
LGEAILEIFAPGELGETADVDLARVGDRDVGDRVDGISRFSRATSAVMMMMMMMMIKAFGPWRSMAMRRFDVPLAAGWVSRRALSC